MSHLHVICILGELTIEVPEYWKVVVEASPILGEINDQRSTFAELDEEKILVIKGYCLLGEVKIRS